LKNYGIPLQGPQKAITERFQQYSISRFGILSGTAHNAKIYRGFSGLKMKLGQQKEIVPTTAGRHFIISSSV
jgi:hypothetical protein